MNLKCIVVEDEPLAMERLCSYIARFPWLTIREKFTDGMDALVYLQTQSVDIVFLDINLGECSGIQLLESIDKKFEVILLTAYSDYALQGYELQVTDYLLKPYSFERFAQAVEKAKNNLGKQTTPEKKWLFVKSANQIEKINLDELLYIEGMRDYRKLHLVNNRKIMTLQTFREFEQELAGTSICRVHKSYMVALGKIDTIDKDGIRMGTVSIPVSDTYRSHFFSLLKG
ncbi:MAG: response regulator transcription factor [Flavipsychrobacter sp.]|nr:response regulator transcription factor [Flavipsychrobacter sp.]